MAPYSMDLRTRVLQDWDEGLKADAVAAKNRVSRAWVHRLVQRRRESGLGLTGGRRLAEDPDGDWLHPAPLDRRTCVPRWTGAAVPSLHNRSRPPQAGYTRL